MPQGAARKGIGDTMFREEIAQDIALNTVWADASSEAILVKYTGTVEFWAVLVQIPDIEIGFFEAMYGVFDNESDAWEFFTEITVLEDGRARAI